MQDDGQARRVADGPERGDRRLAAPGVVVGADDFRENGDGRTVASLGQEPGDADDDEGIGVGQRGDQCRREHRARPSSADRHRGVDGAPAHRDPAVGQGGRDVGRGQRAQPRQCAERGFPDARIGVAEPPPGPRRALGVPAMAGHGHPAPPQVGAPFGARIRGRIVLHRLSMSDPDATADGDPVAIPPSAAELDAGGTPLAPGLDTTPTETAPGSGGRAWVRVRGRRWPTLLVALVVLVLVAGFIAARVNVDYYVITPGQASPVSQFIEVPAAQNHPLTGKILLTDVFVTQLNALSWVQHKVFGSNDEIFSGADLFGGAPTPGQFLNQGFLQMAQAQNFATASALTYLGYNVTSTNAGALVYGIEPHSPASKTLELGQVIKAVDGTPTSTDCALVGALHGLQPRTKVSLSVEQSYINSVGSLVPGAIEQKSVTLGVPPKGLIETGCGPPSKPTAFLGIDPQTQQNWHFPVDVRINTPQIGGPSAGLAMTLGIIDKMSTGRLTGHTVIACTGTIDQYGNVGQVGGVPEKTIAVERAGATVFFVPKPQYAQAEAKASPQLHVYGVNTLEQALQILKRLGGNVPTNPVPA